MVLDTQRQYRIDRIFHNLMSDQHKQISYHCLNVPFLLTKQIIDNITIEQLNAYPLLATSLKMVYDEQDKNRILILSPRHSETSFVWISSDRTNLYQTREIVQTIIETSKDLYNIQNKMFNEYDIKYNGIIIISIICV